jgi:hypothetical protein
LPTKVSPTQLSSPSRLAWAGVQQAANTPDYRLGAKRYGQRFGANVASGVSEGLFANAILPSLLHQDPRLFLPGYWHKVVSGSPGFANILAPFVCREDNGKLQQCTPDVAPLREMGDFVLDKMPALRALESLGAVSQSPCSRWCLRDLCFSICAARRENALGRVLFPTPISPVALGAGGPEGRHARGVWLRKAGGPALTTASKCFHRVVAPAARERRAWLPESASAPHGRSRHANEPCDPG